MDTGFHEPVVKIDERQLSSRGYHIDSARLRIVWERRGNGEETD